MRLFDTETVILAILLAFLIPKTVNSQTNESVKNIKISGEIINNKSGDPVGFATITLKGNTTGTVSNDLGKFSIEATYRAENIMVVSCIGFESTELKISETTYTQIQHIKLTPKEYTIQEVTIKTKKTKAKDIVKMAVARIPQNYFAKELKSYTFERTISRDTALQGYIIEEITLRTPQIKSFDHRDARATRRRFIEKNNKENKWNNIDTVFNGWGSNIFEDDDAFFKSKKFGRWNFRFIPSPSDTLIAIKFSEEQQFNHWKLYNGVMLINRKDLAIVKIDYDYLLKHFSKSHTTVLYKKQQEQYALFYMLTDDKGYNPFNKIDTGMPFGDYTVKNERYCIAVFSNESEIKALIKQITNLKMHPNEWNIPNLPVINLEQK